MNDYLKTTSSFCTFKGVYSMPNILEYIASSFMPFILSLFLLVALTVARIYGSSWKNTKLLEEIRDKLK
jgi:hypothetical protein